VSQKIQSVIRSIDVLIALRKGARTLTELSKDTGLSVSTTLRMLASLSHEEMATKIGNQYVLGPGVFTLWQGWLEGLGLMAGGLTPVLDELRDETGETVALHVAVGAERICIAESQSEQPLRLTSYPGSVAALHLGSAGKVLLAFMDAEERERILGLLEARPHEVSSGGISNVAALREHLAEVRERGWAMSVGERITDAAAISVPVRTERLMAALSILGPSARWTRDRRLEALPSLQRTAAVVEDVLAASDEAGQTATERA
jgi:DNA-binding IclR family transcriptional regulator